VWRRGAARGVEWAPSLEGDKSGRVPYPTGDPGGTVLIHEEERRSLSTTLRH
jgi:hypothetical protein